MEKRRRPKGMDAEKEDVELVAVMEADAEDMMGKMETNYLL